MAKKLLNEAAVRRFQTLANMKPINEMYHKRDEDMMEADEPEMDMDAEAEEMDEEEPMDMDAEMPEEGGMEGDLELTDEEAQAIIELGQKLEAAMGGEGEEMGDMEMGDMEDEEEDMGEEEIMEALRGINYQPSRNEVVNEVAKRVARRLAEAKKAEKRMNEALGRKR